MSLRDVADWALTVVGVIGFFLAVAASYVLDMVGAVAGY